MEWERVGGGEVPQSLINKVHIWVSLSGPVGVRGRIQNTKNSADDQRKVIDLLAAIPSMYGGKKDAWPAPPLAGASGSCPKFLCDAIWDFQSFWKRSGVFHNIDGVVDPDGNTLRQLNALASQAKMTS